MKDTVELSYKAQILRSMAKSLLEEKIRRGWRVRHNQLLEDAAGNVFTFDVTQTDTEVKIVTKRVDLI